ncbi:MAG TPA: glycosyl hydrolase family 28-related protein [Opitutaceae bacterium]|nr:glycosyl hydrolase family 28-related protein [Opitutaceae bacterium]
MALAGLFFLPRLFAVSLPDLPASPRPNPEPAAPAGWDVFTPPVAGGQPAAGAPAIAEWTSTGAPDDTLILTGDQFSHFAANSNEGKDTEFLFYGQTTSSNGIEAPGLIQRLDGLKAAVTLPSILPSWSTYFLWPRNSTGYGYPVAINRTESWWLNPDSRVTRGEVVSVYGRNLSHNGGTSASWVYLRAADGTGQWAAVNSANPYRVQFTVPAALPNGVYEVWIHNGHGGHYGWSGPLSLTITDPLSWQGPVFDVDLYKRAGDADDSDAIDRALVQNGNYLYYHPGSQNTVRFSARVYSLSRAIGLQHDTRFIGAGKTATVLKCNANFTNSSAALAVFCAQGQGRPINSEIRDLTIDANNHLRTRATSGYGYLLMCNWNPAFSTDLHLTNVRFQTLLSNTGCVSLSNLHHLSFVGCDFIGGELFLSQDEQIAIQGCTFIEANQQERAIGEISSSELSLTDSVFADLDITRPEMRGEGRVLAGNSNFGAQCHYYIGNNTTVKLGPSLGGNTGEQILCEGYLNTYDCAAPTAATATTLTLAGSSTNYTGNFATAVIVSGKGLGQYRRVTGYAPAGKVITISPAWNVIPDSSSRVLMEAGSYQWVIYDNNFSGKDYYADGYTAMTAIEPYGGCYDWVGDSNAISDMHTALYLQAVQGYSSSMPCIHPCFFNLFARNFIQSCSSGLRASCSLPNTTRDPGVGFIGNIYRGNNLSDIVDLGAFHAMDENPSVPGSPMDMTLFEHNILTNLSQAFDLSPQDQVRTVDTLLYKNAAQRGASSLPGSFAVNFAPTTSNPALSGNRWEGFETTYAGNSPGFILEVPFRTFDLSSASPSAVMQILNSGTSALSWKASSSAPWLTLSSTDGTIPDEDARSDVTLTCNPAGLSPGTHTATITISAVGNFQVKRVTVAFTTS